MRKGRFILFLLDIILCILTVILGVAEVLPPEIMLLFSAIFGLPLIIFLVVIFAQGNSDLKKDEEKRKENKALRKNYIGFSSRETGTLYLTKRNSVIRTGFSIKEAQDIRMEHVPEELHIGAVTVGGVTTGGTYTTGGYDKYNGSKNGMFCLKYEDKTVYKISLTSELYNKARKSSISKYLNNNGQIMVVDPKLNKYEKEIRNMEMQAGLFKTYGFPSRTKCNEILDWICSDD